MARVVLKEDKVEIRLSLGEEVLALRGPFAVPYGHIVRVSHEPVPDAWFRGIRLGTNLPGVLVAGTFLTGEGTVFCDFHDRSRCLTLELADEHYRRIVVEVDRDQDPATLAEAIAERLAAAGPGGLI